MRLDRQSDITSDPIAMGFEVIEVPKITPQQLGELYREMKEENPDVCIEELEPLLKVTRGLGNTASNA